MSAPRTRRWQIFKSRRRSRWSLVLFAALLAVSMLAPVLANDRPLILVYRGDVFFPIARPVMDAQVGGSLPTAADFADPDTRAQIRRHGWMVMPPVPWSYDTLDDWSREALPAPPSARHWLGTDDQGHDILARVLHGMRISLAFGILLTILSAGIGIAVGAVQGYFGGRRDLYIGRFLEIWSALPQLFILIIISSLIAPSFLTLLVVLLLFGWTSLTGVVRAEFLKTRNLDYVKAARVLGVSDGRIILRHILPNALTAAVTYLPFMLSGAVVALSALDFLGLGLPVGTPSLGELVRQGKENLHAPWIGLTIFIALTAVLSLLLLIGEGIRDALDPHEREGG